MKLSKWARQQGVHYQTAWNWFRAGQIPGAYKVATGSIFVPDAEPAAVPRVVIYARVSNRERKDSLASQAERCSTFAVARGLAVAQVYKEVASGMNDTRREFWRMLDSQPTCIVVENRDRLTRFGFVYLEKLLARSGCEILVATPVTHDNEDLLRDLTSVIYSFCARLYGKRRAKAKLQDIKACL